MINTRFVVSFLLFYTKHAFILFAAAESVWFCRFFLEFRRAVLRTAAVKDCNLFKPIFKNSFFC